MLLDTLSQDEKSENKQVVELDYPIGNATEITKTPRPAMGDMVNLQGRRTDSVARGVPTAGPLLSGKGWLSWRACPISLGYNGTGDASPRTDVCGGREAAKPRVKKKIMEKSEISFPLHRKPHREHALWNPQFAYSCSPFPYTRAPADGQTVIHSYIPPNKSSGSRNYPVGCIRKDRLSYQRVLRRKR
jgi:hypothetical protein